MKHLIIAAVLMLSQMSLAAEKMDLDTHSLLITKLERVLERGGSPDVANVEVRLRLADLLAERARLFDIAAQGKESDSVNADRRRALKHYEIAVNAADPTRRALVLLQMSYLHDTLGEQKQSVELL